MPAATANNTAPKSRGTKNTQTAPAKHMTHFMHGQNIHAGTICVFWLVPAILI